MEKLTRIRVFWKLLLKHFFHINSFCKDCGRNVHDFSVADNIWDQIDKTIKYGHTLCYDCFCEHCKQLNLPVVWELNEISSNPR